MTKAEFLFEKIAATRRVSAEEFERYSKEPVGLKDTFKQYIPLLGPYLSSPGELRTNHPVASFFGGVSAARGARAKNTGKTELGETMAQSAITWAPYGAVMGAGLAASKGKAILPGALMGIAQSAISGGLGGAVNYGVGHLTGRTVRERSK